MRFFSVRFFFCEILLCEILFTQIWTHNAGQTVSGGIFRTLWNPQCGLQGSMADRRHTSRSWPFPTVLHCFYHKVTWCDTAVCSAVDSSTYSVNNAEWQTKRRSHTCGEHLVCISGARSSPFRAPLRTLRLLMAPLPDHYSGAQRMPRSSSIGIMPKWILSFNLAKSSLPVAFQCWRCFSLAFLSNWRCIS